MDPRQLESFRVALLDLGKRHQGDFAGLTSEALGRSGGEGGNVSSAPLHLADRGSDTYDEHISISLLENGGQRLEAISGAIARINHGTFGCCEQCGNEIGVERLQVVPYTEWCIECARAGWKAED